MRVFIAPPRAALAEQIDVHLGLLLVAARGRHNQMGAARYHDQTLTPLQRGVAEELLEAARGFGLCGLTTQSRGGVQRGGGGDDEVAELEYALVGSREDGRPFDVKLGGRGKLCYDVGMRTEWRAATGCRRTWQ